MALIYEKKEDLAARWLHIPAQRVAVNCQAGGCCCTSMGANAGWTARTIPSSLEL